MLIHSNRDSASAEHSKLLLQLSLAWHNFLLGAGTYGVSKRLLKSIWMDLHPNGAPRTDFPGSGWESTIKQHPFPDFNHALAETRSSLPEKQNSCLKYVLVLVLVFLFGSAVVLLPSSPLKQIGPSNIRVIGESLGFIKAGLLIQESLNTSMNPCDDFYEYVCGNYIKNNPLKHGEDNSSELVKMKAKTEYQLMDLLGSNANSTSTAISKMKILYNSCVMEKNYANRTPLVALQAIKSIGHWPIVMGSQNGNINLQEMMEKLESFSIPNIIGIGISRDLKNKSMIIVEFEQGEALFDWKYYQNTTKYKEHIENLENRVRNRIKLFAKDNGYPKNDDFEEQLRDMLDFDFSVGKIMKNPDYYLPDKKVKSTKFDQFSSRTKATTGLDFKKILLAGMPEFARGLITPDTIVKLRNQPFAKSIAKLIKNVKPETFVNYMMYRLMSKFNPFYGKEYRAIDEELNVQLNGDKGIYSSWEKCKNIAMTMKKAVGALYARKHFDQESREVIVEMVGNLKAAFTEMVEETEWMDDKTKKAAKHKAQQMISHIGYNKLAFDDEKLDEYYKDVDVSDFKDFHAMYEKLENWKRNNFFKSFMEADRHEFFDVSFTVNAFSAHKENAILFPAGILQFPIFKKDQPQSINYGSIGFIIGHEITHGFDNQGKKFDEIGQFRNWWANETLKKYNEKSKCMVEQYSSIQVPEINGMHINGKQTLGENIADNGGIRESYRAYQKYVKHHGIEPKVPGVSLSDDQLFFVGFANAFCETNTRNRLLNQIYYDKHSPWKYRVNTPLKNMPEFSEVFNCPVGSPMNPEKKCRVW